MFTGISRDKNNGRHDPHKFRPLCDNATMSTTRVRSFGFDPNLKLVIRILAFSI
jgi:hypothetical protein